MKSIILSCFASSLLISPSLLSSEIISFDGSTQVSKNANLARVLDGDLNLPYELATTLSPLSGYSGPKFSGGFVTRNTTDMLDVTGKRDFRVSNDQDGCIQIRLPMSGFGASHEPASQTNSIAVVIIFQKADFAGVASTKRVSVESGNSLTLAGRITGGDLDLSSQNRAVLISEKGTFISENVFSLSSSETVGSSTIDVSSTNNL